MLKSNAKYGKKIHYCELEICSIQNQEVPNVVGKSCYYCRLSTIVLCKKHGKYRYICKSRTCRDKMATFPEFDFEYLIVENEN